MHSSAKKLPNIASPEIIKAKYSPEVIQREERSLKRAIHKACREFENILENADKDMMRALHLQSKRSNPGYDPSKTRKLFAKHQKYFRHGHEIDPAKIQPRLQLVCDDDSSDLFAIVRSCWSMPYNKGYGRRLRFVILDDYHQAVMGILGLQSPPADLACRDALFEYPAGKKLSMVNRTMDAYTVGAIPPYSNLLAGKLCAGMIATDGVRRAYWRQYAGKKTEMDKTLIQQPLVAVTTSSAFGKSSMYNRIRYGERLLAEPIGFTQGYGLIHLEHLYDRLCEYLKMKGLFNSGGFGSGPKVRWQNVVNAGQSIGVKIPFLQHGLQREVFLYRLVEDLDVGMSGGTFGVPIELKEDDYSQFWKTRWALPRADRFPHWNELDSVEILRNKLDEI